MNRDEITRMAREAGLVYTSGHFDDWIDAGPSGEELMEFAALVAAAEREACAKLCDELDDIRWQECGEYKSGYSEEIRARSQNDGH
jgi:hypothetical protein